MPDCVEYIRSYVENLKLSQIKVQRQQNCYNLQSRSDNKEWLWLMAMTTDWELGDWVS